MSFSLIALLGKARVGNGKILVGGGKILVGIRRHGFAGFHLLNVRLKFRSTGLYFVRILDQNFFYSFTSCVVSLKFSV